MITNLCICNNNWAIFSSYPIKSLTNGTEWNSEKSKKSCSSGSGDDANFIFDLGADSMQSVQLVAGFEEEFDIEMDEDKALDVQNIADAVAFIGTYV